MSDIHLWDNKYIGITKHAEERFREKFKDNKLDLIKEAYLKGDNLSDEETDILFQKGRWGTKSQYWIRIYRKYLNKVFVFQRCLDQKILFITVLDKFSYDPDSMALRVRNRIRKEEDLLE